MLLITTSITISRKSFQDIIPSEVVNPDLQNEVSDDADSILSSLVGIEISTDSDEEKNTVQISPNEDELIMEIGAYLHQIYPTIGVTSVSEEEKNEEIRVNNNHALYLAHSNLNKLKRIALGDDLESLSKFIDELSTEHQNSKCNITIEFEFLNSIYQTVKQTHLKDKLDSSFSLKETKKILLKFYEILDKSKTKENVSPLHWMFQLIVDFCNDALETEKTKIMKFEKRENVIIVPLQKGPKPSTSKVVESVLNKLDFNSTIKVEKVIPPPIKQIVNSKSNNIEVQELLTFKANCTNRQIDNVKIRRNISHQVLQERQQNILETGRVMKVEVQSSANKTKQVSLLCSPECINSTAVFDINYETVSDTELEKLKAGFIKTTAEHLNVSQNEIQIISTSAGSLKLDFKLIMKEIAIKKKAGELYDKIVHQNYLKVLEDTLKIKSKRPITCKAKWRVVCPICYDEFDTIEQGLLCTGVEPHWTCVQCLYELAKVKFEEQRPDIICSTVGCGALYINTHLIQKITNFAQKPDFEFMYTEASLMQYKMAFPYPKHVQCENCTYLTEPLEGQTVWTCGEQVPQSLRNNNRPCGFVWCIVCDPMRPSPHQGNHIRSLAQNIYTQISNAITFGFLLNCPKFPENCNNAASLAKTDGCNKMTCNICGGHFCFECGVYLDKWGNNGYYFEMKDHPCKLWGDDEQISKKKAREKVKKVMEDHGYTNDQVWDVASDLLKNIDWVK